MFLLFLDEFGDFDITRDQNGMVRTDHQSWRPICGYAGFLIPAEKYRHFCDDFAQLRLINLRNLRYAKHTSTNSGEMRLSYEDFRNYFQREVGSLYTKSAEVKGKDIFSGSYAIRGKRKGQNINSVMRRARRLVSIIEKHDGEIFYFGIDKSAYLHKRKGKLSRHLIVDLVRGVIENAYQEGMRRNSQIKLIFDHHGLDDETIDRIKFKQRGVPVHSVATHQTRQEYSQEVVNELKLHRFIKEPAFHVESHWSLGVQAADWVCSLISKNKCYAFDGNSFARYKEFHEKLNDKFEGASSMHSNIKGLERSAAAQLKLPL